MRFALTKSRLSQKPSGKFVAADFDSRRLRLVEVVCKRGRPSLAALHDAAMPEGLDMDSAEAVGAFLGQVLREHHLSGSRLFMNVPRQQAVLKSLILPPGATRDDMPGMVQFQIAKELPFAVEEAVVDFTTDSHFDPAAAPSAEEGQAVLAAAVRLPVVDRYRKIAEVAGAKLERLGLRPQANLRCVEHCVRRAAGERVVLVNVTAEEAEIDVFADNSLAFSRSAAIRVPSGPEMITRGPEVVRSIVLEVMRSLQSFNATNRGGRLGGTLVAGDTGLEGAVAEALGKAMQVRCEVFDPAGAMSLQAGGSASGYIAALGMAVVDPANADASFDFVNPKRPPVRHDRRKIIAIAAVAAAAVVVLAAIIGCTLYIGKLSKEAQRISGNVRELERLNKEVARLKSRADAVARWQGAQIPWMDHVAALTKLLPPPTEAYVTSLQTNYVSARGQERGLLKFTVVANSPDVLEKLEADIGAVKGYEIEPVTPTRINRDPWSVGFEWQAGFEVKLPPDLAVDLAALPGPAERPPDDDSAGRTSAITPPSGSPTPSVPGSSGARPGSGTGSSGTGSSGRFRR